MILRSPSTSSSIPFDPLRASETTARGELGAASLLFSGVNQFDAGETKARRASLLFSGVFCLDAVEPTRPRAWRGCLLVSGVLPHDAGEPKRAVIQRERLLVLGVLPRSGLGAASPFFSSVLRLGADESHAKRGRDGKINAAALFVSDGSPPCLPSKPAIGFPSLRLHLEAEAT